MKVPKQTISTVRKRNEPFSRIKVDRIEGSHIKISTSSNEDAIMAEKTTKVGQRDCRMGGKAKIATSSKSHTKNKECFGGV